jgi:hypothetical protein
MEDIIEVNGQKYGLEKGQYLDEPGQVVYYKNKWYFLIQEEEEKKEWEILSFKGDGTNIASKIDDDLYKYNSNGNEYTKEELLRIPGVIIYSVKRLKDGEVFTVGDKLNDNYNNKYNTILDFELRYDGTQMWACTGGAYTGEDITYSEKAKPLFTSVDGKAIFTDDELHWVIYESYKERYEYNYQLSACPGHKTLVEKKDEVYKVFSTKEAALAWLEANKPKPLFITDDGIEIMDQETLVYGVMTKATWEKRDQKVAQLLKHNYNKEIWKFFSTVQARYNYIFNNKPVLSLKDVKNALGKMDGIKVLSLEELTGNKI